VRTGAPAWILAAALAAALTSDAVPAQDAPPADPVAEAKRLHAEGKEWFNVAGDTDMSREDRKRARMEAYPRLDRAKKLLEAWVAEHPNDEEKLAELQADINIMLFWIRKEAGVGELGGGAPKPPKPDAPPAGAPPAPEAPKPEAPKPEAPKPPTAADELAKIRSYEKAHPTDVPGLHEQYTAFLAKFPDPSSPEYGEASQRLDELGRKMKDVYRLARDEDPDAVAGTDPAEVERLVGQLSPDLKNPDAAVRERAAKYLGNLGSGLAAPSLVEALLSEKEPAVLEAGKESLSRLGGKRVCDRLLKEKPGSPSSAAVVDVLLRIVRKGGVNARIAGEAVGGYAKGLDEAVRADVTSGLAAAGKDAAVGLALAVDLAPVDRKVEYLDLLGQWAVPRTAGHLTKFLVTNPQGARRAQHQAARKAIEAIGKPGVRWLIPALDDKEHQVWTAEMLRQITGAKPKDDKRKTWEQWFRENRKTLEPPK